MLYPNLWHSRDRIVYGNCSKILNTFLFLFSNTMFVFMAGIHRKLDVRITLMEDPDLALCCLSRPFG